MNVPSSKLTIQDLELTANKLQKFALEVFAGNNENEKKQLLEGMENLMNPNANLPIKRPIEVVDLVSEAERIKLTALKVPNLPNEIWMKIISYMKNKDIFQSFALVNKHLHNLTLDPSVVKYLYLTAIKNKAKSKALFKKWLKVIKHSKKLVELKIKDKYNILDWSHLIRETLGSNQYLKSLTIKFDHSGLLKLRINSGFVEALKLANNLQIFQTKNTQTS